MQTKQLAIGLGAFALVFAGAWYLLSGPEEPNAYASRAAGIGFEYPAGYVSEEHVEDGEGQTWHIVLVTEEGNLPPPQDSELPPSIVMIAFDNPEALSAEQWVRTSAASNFNLSDEQIASTTVGGRDAVTYRYSGLYENDAAVVTTEDKIYFFSASWITAEDRIREDFQFLLSTVVFI